MGIRMCIITDIRDSEKILLPPFYFCFFRFSFSLSSLFLCFLFLSFEERILCLTLEERQGMLERERKREGINCFDGGRSMHRACLSSRRVKDFRVVKRPCRFLG